MEVNGKNTKNYPVKDLATEVGMIFQNPESQLFSLCAEDEIAFGPSNLGLPWPEVEKRINRVLKIMSIEHLRNKSPEEMSSGEKQKVAIASALAMEPKILVLDEPTANLDPKSTEEIFKIVKELSKEKIIFLTEHDIDKVAHYSDKLMLMDGGEIKMEGTPDDVLTKKELIKYIYPPKICWLGWKLGFESPPLRPEELVKHIKVKEKLKIEKRIKKSEPVIKIKNLSFEYEKQKTILKDINLDVYKGEFLAIVGENGSGKSTLALHLNGLLKSNKGNVLINGIDTRKTKVAELSKIVGYVFQDPDQQIFADSIDEEISFGPRNLKIGEKEISKRVTEALNYTKMEKLRHNDPFSLSFGQKKRITIASILAMKPQIIILDEPTTALDMKTAESVMSLVKGLNKKGHTIIMITHDMELVAEYAERVVVMKNGEILDVDEVRNIFKNKELLQKANLIEPELVKLGKLVGEPNLLRLSDALEVLEKNQLSNSIKTTATPY